MNIKLKLLIGIFILSAVHPMIVRAQNINDAFVLVDVSGSMKSQQINNEAREIIYQMLDGSFDVSNLSDGWKKVDNSNICPLFKTTKIIQDNSQICIMPFGNCERMKDYTFIDVKSFSTSFHQSFPKVYKDSYTYLSLARAYVVHSAIERGINKMVYLIVYSDGKGTTAENISYPGDLQKIWDFYGTNSNSYSKKIGVLRKVQGNRNYDIEVWTLGPIQEMQVREGNEDKEEAAVEPRKISIVNPQKGESQKHPIEIDVDEKVNVVWNNSSGRVKINVQMKDGAAFKNIKAAEQKDFYIKKSFGNSANLTFVEGGEYKIIVSDERSNDTRFVSVSTSILTKILPFIIGMVLCMGGLYIWKLVSSSSSKPRPEQSSGRTSLGKEDNKKDDW